MDRKVGSRRSIVVICALVAAAMAVSPGRALASEPADDPWASPQPLDTTAVPTRWVVVPSEGQPARFRVVEDGRYVLSAADFALLASDTEVLDEIDAYRRRGRRQGLGVALGGLGGLVLSGVIAVGRASTCGAAAAVTLGDSKCEGRPTGAIVLAVGSAAAVVGGATIPVRQRRRSNAIWRFYAEDEVRAVLGSPRLSGQPQASIRLTPTGLVASW